MAEEGRPAMRADGVGTQTDGGTGAGAADRAAPSRKPTLKTIAALTGLAVPTVSRALGGAPDLAEATKALVRRVADELGYVPNRAGVRLRTGRTNVIALFLSTETEMMNHTARLISSVAATLQGTPFHLNVTPTFPGEDPLRAIRHVVEAGLADAVIFNQTRPRDLRVAWLLERGFPFATHGRTDWADRHAWFDFDNEAWVGIGLRRLAALGRGRVAVLAPPLDQNYAQDIARGVARPPEGVEAWLIEDTSSDDVGTAMQAAFGRALDGGADALVSASAMGALAAVAAVEERALRLGRDVDLFAKEAIPFLNLVRPGILSMREDVARAGSGLARAAIQAIRDPHAPPLRELEVPQDPAGASPTGGRP